MSLFQKEKTPTQSTGHPRLQGKDASLVSDYVSYHRDPGTLTPMFSVRWVHWQ